MQVLDECAALIAPCVASRGASGCALRMGDTNLEQVLSLIFPPATPRGYSQQLLSTSLRVSPWPHTWIRAG